MNEVKISYILPCYNVENYIATCLESLIKQTLNEIEIICINDGSTDDTLSVIKSYQSKDNRIKVVTYHNQGPGYARNLGIDIALGEYINFVDPDDYLDKKTAEISYNKIKKFNTDVLSYNANVVKIPNTPEKNPTINVSALNIDDIFFFEAPIALNTPISFVLSNTDI